MKLLLLLLLTAPLMATLQESALPEMERAYVVDPQKVATNQYQEIEKASAGERIRLVSYNMLFNLFDETRPEEYRWTARLPRIAEWIEEADPDVIASQELYRDQLTDLLTLIGEQYAFYGIPSVNADGSESELNGIFYRKERFECLFTEALFMSSTPEIPSPDPFGKMERTLTGVHLMDMRTGKIFGVYNAHHAFGSCDSREYSTRFTLQHLAPLREMMPLVVTGDLNTFPTRTDLSLPYYDGHYLHRLFRAGGFEEAEQEALLGHVGPISTFTNAAGDGRSVFVGTGTPGVVLDHIYVNRLVTVLIHATDGARVDGYFPSDHLPVLADLVL